MHYNKIRFAVGIFVLSFFLVVLASLSFVLDEKGFFDKKYRYFFNIKSAESFSVGMPLKFSGFSVGVIDNISLKDDGSVMICFLVDENNKKWIREGTFLTIKKPLIGSAYIVVDTKLDRPLLKAGATLEITQSDDINDMIERLDPVVKKIIKIIDSIDIIAASMASEDSDLFAMLKNLNKFSEKLANNDALLTSITGDTESTQSLITSLQTLKESMKDVKIITHGIAKPTVESAKNLNFIMKDVRKKLQTLDGVVSTTASLEGDLVEVKEQLSVAIEKSNEVLDKVDKLLGSEDTNEVVLP